MDNWRFVERVTVRHAGGSFIAEARNGPFWSVGEIKATPADAMESAVAALKLQITPSDDWEDLL